MLETKITRSAAAVTVDGACPVEITAAAAKILRVRIGAGPFDPAASYLPSAEDRPALPMMHQDGVSRTGAMAFRIGVEPLTLEILDGAGAAPLRLRLDRVDLRRGLRLPLEFIGEQHFYGLGGGGQRLDRLGVTRRFWNSHINHGQGADVSVPLMLSSAGYGLFFDHSGDASLDPGDSNDDVLADYSCADGRVDIHVLAGATMRETLGLAADLLGHAPMPPRWALGFLQSTRHFDDTDELLALADGFRKRNIPCDGIVLLSTYSDQHGWNAGVGHLTFDPLLLPDPRSTIGALKQRGFRVITHEYAVLHRASPLYAEAEACGYCLDDGYADIVPTARPSSNYLEGQRYLDFSQPAVRGWWWRAHADLVALGIDGWWLDGGEGPAAATRLQAGPGDLLHNRFDLMRHQAFAEGEAADRSDRRAFMLCRSGGAGMQRYGAACWSGDVNNTFTTLAAQIPAGLTMGLSGVPYWGTDIGGYYATVADSDELFVRWFQFGAFCSIFRAHGRDWRRHTPWGRGPMVEAICRRFIELRYQLMPYLYTLAWEAHRDGLPFIRPMILDNPSTDNWDRGDQFMLGDAILVAPITEEAARQRSVHLPPGTWHDHWTGRAYIGPTVIVADAPLELIPVFLRGGVPLPLAEVVQFDQGPTAEITILIHPSEAGQFVLHDDDGTSRAYECGAHASTRIICEPSRRQLTVTIEEPQGDLNAIPADRRYRLRISVAEPPQIVTIAALEHGTPARSVDAAWKLVGDGHVVVDAGCGPARVTLAWP